VSSRIRRRSTFFTLHRPDWQANLPRGLRIAAEWQFGTLVLAALVGAFRDGEIMFIPMALALQGFWFLFLTGFREDRRINSPVAWWALVVFLTCFGLLLTGVMIFDPPEYRPQ
jgi:Na+-driven multidrug efflux pump